MYKTNYKKRPEWGQNGTLYSHGQPKPTYFAAVGITIQDMTETPP